MDFEFKWQRGPLIGEGSYGSVNHVLIRSQSHHHLRLPTMVVKSASLSHASSLIWEKLILADLQDCPHVVRSLGHCLTSEGGLPTYNLFLEYVPGGTLAHIIENSISGQMQESDVRRYTESLLLGLYEVHNKGYVHCDIKPDNILLVSPDSYEVRIADFGLALKSGIGFQYKKGAIRGTLYYMAPESVSQGAYDLPADIWALGCCIVAMVSGNLPWSTSTENVDEVLFKLGRTDEFPEIPHDLSIQGKDFLSKCFVKDPSKRWTAQMLLEHPFVMDEMRPVDKEITCQDEEGFLGFAAEPSSFIPLPDTLSVDEEEESLGPAAAASFIRKRIWNYNIYSLQACTSERCI